MTRYFRYFFFALTAAVLVMTPARTRAQSPVTDPVIWDVKVVLGEKDVSCGEGWTRIDQDLDEGVDAEHVYLCVSYDQKDWSTPIGGMVVCQDTCEDDGYTKRVPAFPDRHGYLNTKPGDEDREFGYFRTSVEPLTAVKFVVVPDSDEMDDEIAYHGFRTATYCNDGFSGSIDDLWDPMPGRSNLNDGGLYAPYIFACERHQLPRGKMSAAPLYGFALAITTRNIDRDCVAGWTPVSYLVRQAGYSPGFVKACITRDPNAPGAFNTPITFIGLTHEEDQTACGQTGGIPIDGPTNLGQPGNLWWADDEESRSESPLFCVSRLHSAQYPNVVVDDFRVAVLAEEPENPGDACRIAYGSEWQTAPDVTDGVYDNLNRRIYDDDDSDESYRAACVHYATEYGADRFDATWTAPDRVTAEANVRTQNGPATYVDFDATATAFDGQDLEVWCKIPGVTEERTVRYWTGVWMFTAGTTRLECRASGNDSSPRGGWHGIDIVVTNSPPVISVPIVPVVEATSAAGAVVTFHISALDALDGTRPVTCDPSSGSTFPVGNSQSICRSTDSDDNQSSRTVGIFVRDTIAPTILAPLDVYISVDTAGMGAQVSDERLGNPIVTDNAIKKIWRQPSINFFPYGTTQVTWIVEDMGGHTAMATQRVVVGLKADLPTVTAPASFTVEAAGPFGAMVSPEQLGQPTSTGAAITSISRIPNIGVFPIGTTTITWNVFVGVQLQTVQQRVTVVDTKAPEVTGRLFLPVELQGSQGGYVDLAALNAATNMVAAADAVGVVSLTPSPAGPWFPLGTTDVTWTARDAAGNAGTFLMKIIVRDQTAPAIDSVPSAVTAEATSTAGALVGDDVLGRLTAHDSGGEVTVTRIPAGNQFPLGETLIRWIARDPAGNSSEATQVVLVRDTTAPALTAGAPVVVEASSAAGATLAPAALQLLSSTDAVGVVTITRSPAGLDFPIGTTTVTWTATDAAGNSATAAQDVVVRDTTAPVLSLPAPIKVDATAVNGAPVPYQASASDVVDGVVVPSCSPASGSTFAIGVTTVTCVARDARGNSATGSFTIDVVLPSAGQLIAALDQAIAVKRLDQQLHQILRSIERDRDRRACAQIARLRDAIAGSRQLDPADQAALLGLVDLLAMSAGCGQ